MRRFIVGALIASACMCAQAADPAPGTGATTPAAPAAHQNAPAAASVPLTPAELDNVMYAVGLLVGRNLDTLSLTPHELALVQKGVADAAMDKPSAVDLKVYQPKVQQMATERAAESLVSNKAAGKAYADKIAAQPGATRTATGIVIKTLTPGTGASPIATDSVKVNYEGRLIGGKVFDSTAQSGMPLTIGLSQVVPCWTAAVQLMKVGGKAEVVCPSETAYGDRTKGDIRPGSTLVFTIELLDIVK